jgi:hypothetical protein
VGLRTMPLTDKDYEDPIGTARRILSQLKLIKTP